MGAKYQVYKDVAGKFRFRLRAENNKIVAVSQAYEQHAGCVNGVESVQANCDADIEDMTVEGKQLPNPKYQVFYDKTCGYRFHLNAKNGEIIAASEGYKTKEGCMNGISAVQASCNAEIEDMTVKQAETADESMMETSVVATEMPMEAEGIKLELVDLPDMVQKGDIVYFKGKLTENGKGVSKAKITIREHDRSYLMDEVLAKGYTEEDGSFDLGWKARMADLWDDTAEIYAQYDRDKKPKHIRSEIQSVIIK
ncbi:DUF1508 domain-containing protein [Candidatus Bathyarchaeota archaeon]|nr:DUF1508 domain-containing protein [Candidatus Bathyarchaeota archaeon]